MNLHGIERAPDERVNWKTSLPFFLVHALVLLSFVTGVTPTAIAIFLVLYWSRMFFITAGYHRYFSHRSYKLGRGMQFVMAFGGGTHYCLGSQFARREVRTMLRKLAEQLDHIEPAGTAEWTQSNFVSGVKHLPVSYRFKD